MISHPRPTFQLRRLGQLEAMPGLLLDDLKTLAEWAHLHPMDEISMDGRTWIKAHEFKELGMIWLVLNEGQVVYGPTSVGTLKEFFVQGEIHAGQWLRHHTTGEKKTLREVIGDDYIRRIESQAASAGTAPVAESAGANRAERVRLLETRLESTQRELGELTRSYREALKELVALRPPPSLATFAGFSH